MKDLMKFSLITTSLVALLCPFAFSQNVTHAASTPSTSPVAYVYVSSSPSQNKHQINAYSAASNGKLTAVSGSPFAENGSYMALNGKWLFSTNSVYIYSFSIASNGALKLVSSINAEAENGYADGGPVSLFLDHTGSTLYDEDIYGSQSANNTYQFFGIDQSTGVLSYLGATSVASVYFETPLSFIGDNEYAYGASCYEGNPAFYGFSRSDTGTLTDLNINPAIPAAKKGGYCPSSAAADPTNHIAIPLLPVDDITEIGPPQLSVYTSDSSGNLTTTSTDANMPTVTVAGSNYGVNDVWMSPSGKLLAVAGVDGLEVFHFNGANPITKYTGALTSDNINQVFWDNDNHLYAVSYTGKLYVFTVTPSSYSQAPGSPYSITGAENLIVLPK